MIDPDSEFCLTHFRCCCGLVINAHTLRTFVVLGPDGTRHSGSTPPIDPRPIPNEHWNPAKHTLPFPTDAYGCIDFRGSHTNKAQYIRYRFYSIDRSIYVVYQISNSDVI